MKCDNPSCGRTWKERKKNPKQCPYCKRYQKRFLKKTFLKSLKGSELKTPRTLISEG